MNAMPVATLSVVDYIVIGACFTLVFMEFFPEIDLFTACLGLAVVAGLSPSQPAAGIAGNSTGDCVLVC